MWKLWRRISARRTSRSKASSALVESSLPRGGRGGRGWARECFAGGENQTHIFGAYGILAGEEDETLDNVAEFANIAGPGIAAQFCDSFVGEDLFFPAVLLGDLLRKVSDESGKIFQAFTQGRQGKGKDEDAVKEIAAKFIFLDQVFEVAVRGDDDANIDLDGLVATDALDFAFFQDAEKFGLHGDGHVANFIEKKRAAFGLFEFAGVAAGRAGEGALFVAEQLGFDELGRDGSAIQSDESVFVARGFFVDGAGDEFFAGAGFAEDADAGFAGGDAIDLRKELWSWRGRSRRVRVCQGDGGVRDFRLRGA